MSHSWRGLYCARITYNMDIHLQFFSMYKVGRRIELMKTLLSSFTYSEKKLYSPRRTKYGVLVWMIKMNLNIKIRKGNETSFDQFLYIYHQHFGYFLFLVFKIFEIVDWVIKQNLDYAMRNLLLRSKHILRGYRILNIWALPLYWFI